MRPWIVALALTAPLVAATPALAQSGPSVEQIIRSLTPSGDVTKAGTRGIRLSPPAETRPTGSPATPIAAQPAPGARSAPPAPPAEQRSATINLTVNFATGSAELTPQAVAVLDRLGTALASQALSSYRFRIEGHTDTVGTRDYNLGLSERRAEAVVTYIQDKFGVDAGRMEAVGLGANRPLVVTADQQDEPRNRRVQVWNIGS